MRAERPIAQEVATLLEDGGSESPPLDPEINGAAWASQAFSTRRRICGVSSPRGVLVLASVVKFGVTMCGTMSMLPLFRVFEDIFCHRYFNDSSPGFIEEKKCKVSEVQQSLAYFMGWLMLVIALVGVVIALPYAALADRIGRKPVLIMAFSGLALSFATSPMYFSYLRGINPYWILPGCIFQAVGGGIPVIFTTLYSIAADVTDEKNRGSSFLMLMIGATAGGLIGPPISGVLMESFDPWFPIYVVAAICPIILAGMFLLPETLQRRATDTHEPSQTAVEWARSQITASLLQARAATSLLRNPSVALVLLTFLTHSPVNAAHTMTLVQYVSQQFGWDIAQTSFLLSPLGVMNVIVLACLPKVAGALTSPTHRSRLSAFRKDSVLARTSFIFIVTACLIEGLSRSITPFVFGLFTGTFGAAASPLSRTLLTHYVDSRFTSRLMALISIVETAGAFLGGPLIAVFFQIGQEKGGSLTGLPFLYVGALAAGALVCLMYIRAPEERGEGEEVVGLSEQYVDEPRGDGLYSDEPDAPIR